MTKRRWLFFPKQNVNEEESELHALYVPHCTILMYVYILLDHGTADEFDCCYASIMGVTLE